MGLPVGFSKVVVGWLLCLRLCVSGFSRGLIGVFFPFMGLWDWMEF